MKKLLPIFFVLIGYNTQAQIQFIWPIKKMPAYSEVADCYSVNNYVDQNTITGAAAISDWNCNTGNNARTYDGHLGVDIDLWPFHWNMMDNNYVAVVAAAPGRVVAAVSNQNNENNCGPGPYPNSNWNYIAIRHNDSSTSIYGHLRDNSIQVVVGQIVEAGDVIAYVGSSGSSSNPHLHFEVNRNPVNNSPGTGNYNGVIDPYFVNSSCNNLNNASLWAIQKSYWEPAVVRVMTHGSRPSLPGYLGNNNLCRSGEVMNAKAAFLPNDSIYFGIAVRDFLQNQSFTLSVFDPNGALWFSSTATNNSSFPREKEYITVDNKIPNSAMAGTYTAVVDFNGTSATHFFSISCPASQNVPGSIIGYKGFKASDFITSTATISSGNRLLLQAGTKITLLPGFSTANGAVLKARIKDCNYSE